MLKFMSEKVAGGNRTEISGEKESSAELVENSVGTLRKFAGKKITEKKSGKVWRKNRGRKFWKKFAARIAGKKSRAPTRRKNLGEIWDRKKFWRKFARKNWRKNF
jgi:hypothetical protein